MNLPTPPPKRTILRELTSDLYGAVGLATGVLGLLLLVGKYLADQKWQDALFAVVLAVVFVVSLYKIGTKRVAAALVPKDAEITRLKGKVEALRKCIPPRMTEAEHHRKSRLKWGLVPIKAAAAQLYTHVAQGLGFGHITYFGQFHTAGHQLVPPGGHVPPELSRLWSLMSEAEHWHEHMMIRYGESRRPIDGTTPPERRKRFVKEDETKAATEHRDAIFREIEAIEQREGLIGLPETLPPEPPSEEE